MNCNNEYWEQARADQIGREFIKVYKCDAFVANGRVFSAVSR